MQKRIVDKLRRKDRKAQEYFYRTNAKAMFLICYRYLGNEEEASEIVNDGFYKVFNKIHKFRDGGMDGLMAWTRKIMVNECLQQLRRRKRIWFPDDEIPETEEVSNLPEIAMDAEIYFDLIRQLPESQKTVFNLYVVEGYTHLEIAEVLQIPENTSRSYLMRARNELQIKIKKMHENELQ